MLRRATLEDASAIFSVHMASIRTLAACTYSAEQVEAWCGVRESSNYFSPILNKVVFIAEQDGRVVGFSQMAPEPGVVEAVYVHPSHAGLGLGMALLRAVETEAVARGIAELVLDASLNAVEFYAKAGYRSGQSSHHEVRPGVSIPCVTMSRSLRPPSGA